MPLASSKPNLKSQRPVITLKSPVYCISLKMDDTSEGSGYLMENLQICICMLAKAVTLINNHLPITTTTYGDVFVERNIVFTVKMGFVSCEW